MDSWMDKYAITGIVTSAGIYQMMCFAKAVGLARGKYNVTPPEINGPPEFNRVFRAQQNCLEFYPVSLTCLWTSSVFFHPVPASLAYCGYMFARRRYFTEYSAKSENRVKPFYLTLRFLMMLIAMSTAGVGHKAIRYYGNVDVWKMLLDALPSLSN